MTKNDIIKAAFSAWEPDLYKSMSLSALSSYLGVTKTALYRHFANKEAIVDAMFASFFDDYFEFIQPRFEESLKAESEIEGLFTIIRGITEFYARNKTAFIFSLCHLGEHKNDDSRNMGLQMKKRGIELQKLPYFISREKSIMTIQFASGIAIFMTAVFFHSGAENPGKREIQKLLDQVEYQISYGLGFTEKDLNSIKYDELDTVISRVVSPETGKDNLLKAVANAIAQAGPWEASMELVAKNAGLSKSGLYSHFKSKEDMLRQFFTTEFEKIYGDLAVFPKTEKPEEQLYLITGSSIRYLQDRPEIMISLDWIRTQRIDLGLSMPGVVISWFSDPRFIRKVPGARGRPLSLEVLPHYLIFCIMGLLKKCYSVDKNIKLSKENIRFFYRFLISGIKGGIV